MPIPDHSSLFVGYTFTVEEARNAQVLTALQQAYLQTLRADYAQELATMQVPESAELDRATWLKRVELQTKIDFITELFDNHKAALTAVVGDDSDPTGEGSQPEGNLADRAAKLVHKQL